MARQNRWAAFGDAFNAVYNVGTTLGRDLDTLKITNRKDEDWKDAEGNQLTGAGLQQARYNALANIEDKWGSAKDGLALRTGAIDYATKDENLRYQNDTHDDRVRYVGLRNDNLASATGLNVANTGRVNLANDFTRATQPGEISKVNAQNTGLTTAYRDPSYSGYLIADQEARMAERGRDTTQAGVQNTYYGSPVYGQSLTAAGEANIASNQMVKARDSAEAAMYSDPTYRAGRVATGQMEGLNAQTDLNVARNTQDQRYNTGVATANTAQANADSGLLDSRRSLAMNQAITDWSQTGDPNNPESVGQLITTIERLNPEAGWGLRQNYNTHELGQIVHNSVLYKAQANDILQKGGLPGLQQWIDDRNGANGVKVETDAKTGAIAMYETNPDGSRGRTIANGADEEEFYVKLQGYLDPSNMMAISKGLYDQELVRAQAAYNRAQAQAKGTLTMDAFIAGRLQQNPADPLALALAFRSNPEAVPDMVTWAQKQNIEGSLGGNGGIPPNAAVSDPANPSAVPFNPNTPRNPQDEANARNVVTTALTLNTDMSISDRAAMLQQNEALLRTYNLYDAEAAKLALASEAEDTIKREGVAALLEDIRAGLDPSAGPSNPRGLQSFQARQQQLRQQQALMNDPNYLGIVLSGLKTVEAQSTPATGNARPASERRLETLRGRISELEQYIQSLQTAQ